MDFKLKKSNLNFRVYSAATLPTSGKENDIVIISETPMENWILSPDKPEGAPRTDGDVWIQYSVTGATFNILKNGTMKIKCTSVQQYINGIWKEVTANSYQNGEWVNWIDDNAEIITELNASGYAFYSEDVAGEYVRSQYDRGFTRTSSLPVIWCWSMDANSYDGPCMLAATKEALSITSVQSNGEMTNTTIVTPNGNTLHVSYGTYLMATTVDNVLNITSDGRTVSLTRANRGSHYFNTAKQVLDEKLLEWADTLLFK